MNRPARSQWGLASGRKVQASDDSKSVLSVQGHSGCLQCLIRLDSWCCPCQGLALRTLWRLTQTCSSHCHSVGPCCLLFQVWQLCHNWLARRLTGIHFKLSPRFPGRSLAAALPIRASGGRGPATIQHQVQSCECKLLFRLEAAILLQCWPRCQWFQVCKPALLTVTPSSRGTRSTMLFRKVSATDWSLIPCKHFTLSVSVSHLHSQSSWNTSYVLSWNYSCFKIVILLSTQLKYQLAAFESFNLIHFHFFSIAWMIKYILVVSFFNFFSITGIMKYVRVEGQCHGGVSFLVCILAVGFLWLAWKFEANQFWSDDLADITKIF